MRMSLLLVYIAEKKLLHILQALHVIIVRIVSIHFMWIGIFLGIVLQIVSDLWSQLGLIIKRIKAIWSGINVKNVEKKYQILLLQMMILFLWFEN